MRERNQQCGIRYALNVNVRLAIDASHHTHTICILRCLDAFIAITLLPLLLLVLLPVSGQIYLFIYLIGDNNSLGTEAKQRHLQRHFVHCLRGN